MSGDNWASVVEHAIWPVVVLILVVVLRRPLIQFFGMVAGRITKLSVLSVSVELATATRTDPPWRGVGGNDARGLVMAQQVNDSYFDTLRQALAKPGSADYFVVDLRNDGDEWLTSRLYLFSYLLQRLRGVQTVVFVATRGDVAGSFLGVAAVAEVIGLLGDAYPGLRIARLRAEAEHIHRVVGPMPTINQLPVAGGLPVPGNVDDWCAEANADSTWSGPLAMAQGFLRHLQWAGPVAPSGPWLRMPDQPGQAHPTWEYATWLRSSDLTDGLLRGVVRPDGFVIDKPSWSAEDRARAVLAVPGDPVALLNQTRRVQRLIDRRALLASIGRADVEAAQPA